MRPCHDRDTHWKRRSDLAGRRARISSTISSGSAEAAAALIRLGLAVAPMVAVFLGWDIDGFGALASAAADESTLLRLALLK
jgi:hypothetical protein